MGFLSYAGRRAVHTAVTLVLLLIGCAVLLAALGLLLWIGGLTPWQRQRRPADPVLRR